MTVMIAVTVVTAEMVMTDVTDETPVTVEL